MKLLGENVVLDKKIGRKNGFFLIYFCNADVHTFTILEKRRKTLISHCQYGRYNISDYIEYVEQHNEKKLKIEELSARIDAVYSLTNEEALLHISSNLI